jgi:hypothetical protein
MEVDERLKERAGLVERRARGEERYFAAPHDTAEEAAAEAEMEAAEAAIEKLDEAVAWAKEEARGDDIRAAQEDYDIYCETFKQPLSPTERGASGKRAWRAGA